MRDIYVFAVYYLLKDNVRIGNYGCEEYSASRAEKRIRETFGFDPEIYDLVLIN